MTTYGKDIRCTDTATTGRYSTGLRLVAEAAYRRLITPRGSLRGAEDEADYGLDLQDLIGSVTTKDDIASLPDRIKSELTKDERIIDVVTVVTDVSDGPGVALELSITGFTDAGPFDLQVGVDEVSVELLGIKAES